MPKITDAELREMLEYCEAAPKGPWQDGGDCIDQLTDAGKGYPLNLYLDSEEIIFHEGKGRYDCACSVGWKKETRIFCTRSRTDLPRLVKALQAANAREAQLEAELAAANTRLDIRHERVMELEGKMESFRINEREALEVMEESYREMWEKENERAEKAEAQRDAALDVCRDYADHTSGCPKYGVNPDWRDCDCGWEKAKAVLGDD